MLPQDQFPPTCDRKQINSHQLVTGNRTYIIGSVGITGKHQLLANFDLCLCSGVIIFIYDEEGLVGRKEMNWLGWELGQRISILNKLDNTLVCSILSSNRTWLFRIGKAKYFCSALWWWAKYNHAQNDLHSYTCVIYLDTGSGLWLITFHVLILL